MSLERKVIEWLAGPSVGESSKNMAFTAVGVKYNTRHPLDPADFNRCLKLVKQVPEIKNHFGEISKLSSQWKIVIDNWDLIESTFLDEAGIDWRKGEFLKATKTYELMKVLGL